VIDQQLEQVTRADGDVDDALSALQEQADSIGTGR